MPKLRGIQPTPPGLAMSYIPDARIVDGDAITPRHLNSGGALSEMFKEGSTRQANSLYHYKLIQQWLHKGDIRRWTKEVSRWASVSGRRQPFFFDKDCKPGGEDHGIPWTLKISKDALRTRGLQLLENGVVQITCQGRDNIEYEVARCPLWAATQLMQHHKLMPPGLSAKEVIDTYAPEGLRPPNSSMAFADDIYYDDPDEEPAEGEEEVALWGDELRGDE